MGPSNLTRSQRKLSPNQFRPLTLRFGFNFRLPAMLPLRQLAFQLHASDFLNAALDQFCQT